MNFSPVVEDFADTLHALREFVASLCPVLLQRETELSKTAVPLLGRFAAAQLLTSDEAAWEHLADETKQSLREAKGLVGASGGSAKPPDPVVMEIVSKTLPIKYVNGKPEVDWNLPDATRIIPSTRAIVAIKKELRLLHESALMALTSRSEWFIAQLLHLYFDKYPGAAGMSEPFFSLDSLASLQTIDDAKGMLIDHRVEALMRESLVEWLDFFKNKPKLGMSYLANERGRMSEIFKRRNLVVHNGGRANRRYFKEVDEALRPGIALGEVVEVTTGYLNASMDLIEHQFLLLAAELWKHLEPTDNGRGLFLMTAAVRGIDEGRWGTARGLSYFGMNDKDLPEGLRLSNQINYWQSFKWAGQFDEIRKEVEKTDFSAKAPLYRLAYAAITDDVEACFALIPDLLESNELQKYQLNSWPLFQELRKCVQFAAFKMSDEDIKDEGDLESSGKASGEAVN